MTVLSRHNYQHCPKKHATRIRTLKAATQCPALWNRQDVGPAHPYGRLGVSWLEITGEGDPTFQLLLRAAILGAPYIGVNGPFPPATPARARRLLQLNRTLFKQETEQGLCEWHYGLLQHVLSRNPDTYSNVGVIVADTSETLASPDTIHTLADIFSFARRQAKILGQCLLMINTSSRGVTGQRLKKRQREWLREVGDACGVGPIPKEFSGEYRNKGSKVSMFPVWVLVKG